MKKIMHIITRLDMGGSAQNTLLTCLDMAGKYKIILVHGLSLESCMSDSETRAVEELARKAKDRGVRFVSVSSLVRRMDPVQDALAFFYLLGLIRREKPDLVHTHTSKAGILGRWAAKLSRVPCIAHTPHGHVFYGHFSPLKSELFRIVEKITALFTHRLVALTQGEKADHIRLRVCPDHKMAVIPSGVDIERFTAGRDIQSLKKTLGIDPKRNVVGTIGWLLPIKGPQVLLRAMIQVWTFFPDVELVYAGKGPLQESLETEAQRLGAGDKVKFLGWRNDIPDILQVFDIFVLPSLNEGMGRVIVEAMAAGKPVAASRTGGIPDLIRHGENGLLAPPGDPQGLAKAVLYLMENPDAARRMGERGRTLCRGFSHSIMIQKMENLYKDLLNEKSYDREIS
jgi:glycosyltransferase involved in cell wall biosynthesis